MRLDELIQRLASLRGSGQWKALSERSGVDYVTISRIYRGVLVNPGIKTVEKLVDALIGMTPKRQAKAAPERQNGALSNRTPKVER